MCSATHVTAIGYCRAGRRVTTGASDCRLVTAATHTELERDGISLSHPAPSMHTTDSGDDRRALSHEVPIQPSCAIHSAHGAEMDWDYRANASRSGEPSPDRRE